MSLMIECKTDEHGRLPGFTVTVEQSEVCSIYSDPDLQDAFLEFIQQANLPGMSVFDGQDGLYERLKVEENVKFYHKWFGCKVPLAEVLVLFKLTACAKTPLHTCSFSEKLRVRYAKYFMMGEGPLVFVEPIQSADQLTAGVFLDMLGALNEAGRPVILLVSNMDHALRLGSRAYRLHQNGLDSYEEQAEEPEAAATSEPVMPLVADLFKVSAKIEDKVILFDPTEIDYIESQEGKAFITINEESFALDSSLAAIEKKLEMYGFYRCHRSYIVNLQKVREIITWSKNTYSLRLNNRAQSTIPLSRTKVQDIQNIFNVR